MPISFTYDDENPALKNAPVILPTDQQGPQPMATQQGPAMPGMPGAADLNFQRYGSPVGPEVGPKQRVGFEYEPKPSVGTKMWNRFWGTDVEDPMPWTRLATQLVGSLSGGIPGATMGGQVGSVFGPMGTVAGTAIGGIVGGIAGVTAGSAAPEATMELGELTGLLAPGYREEHGLSNDEMRTMIEGEALIEIATGGGISLARTASRGLSKLVTRTGAETMRTAAGAADFAIDLMPVQVGSGKIPRAFVNVMGQFPWVGTPLRKQGLLIEEQVKYAVDNLPSRIAPAFSSPAIGRQVVDDVKKLAGRIDNYFGEAYKALDDAAEASGAVIRPEQILSRADTLLSQISDKTPSVVSGSPTASKALERVKSFIQAEIYPLRATMDDGSSVVAEQSISRMRGMTDKINEQIGMLVKDGIPYKSRPVEMLISLRNSAQMDMLTNVYSADTQAAKRLMADYKELNAHFSTTMSELFETSAAKRIRSVSTGGARGTGAKATRTTTDSLMRILLHDESPQIVDEVQQLVSKETFNNMAANYLQNKLTAATKVAGTESQFNVDAFAKLMGFTDKNSNRYLQAKRLLDKTAVPISDVEKLADYMRVASDINIPNMSQFVARRASLGGLRAVKNAVLPGALLAGGGAGMAATHSGIGTIAVGLGSVLGMRAFSKMISNPDNARPLAYVMNNEINKYAWRRSQVAVVRGALQALADEGEITQKEFTTQLNDATIFIDEVIGDTLDYMQQRKQEKRK